MSPISLSLNLLLAGLLILTLMYGYRLSRQLKALRDSHESFAHAVGDLDRAALRAETGLSELRASTDEAVDLLAGRIEKGRELAKQLDALIGRAEATLAKTPPSRPAADVRSIFDRPRAAALQAPAMRQTSDAEAEAAAEALILRLSETEALTLDIPEPREAVARVRGADRELRMERAEARPERRFDTLFQRPGARPEPRQEARPEARPETRYDARSELRLDSREDTRPAPRAEARPNPRSRAMIDDDLFDPPARGGRLRAFDGGRA